LIYGIPADQGCMMEIFPAAPPASVDLARLEQEEQAISRQRSVLSVRIDDLYVRAPLDGEQVAELDELEELERCLSLDRRNLHIRIEKLRAELGLPPVGEGRELNDDA
jgi:hypothetical protein